MALTKISGSILKDPLNLGEVSIGGTLTYQDVTNVDSIGLGTFRSGIDCNGDLDVDGHTNLDNVSIAGVTTTTDNINIGADNKKLQIGASQDLQLFHDGGHSRITNTTGILKLTAPAGQSVRVVPPDDSGNVAVFHIDGSTHLYYDSAHKFSTVSDGIDVVGNILMMDSLTHRSDTDTKIRFPANDTVSFETAGSERLRINSSGFIGMGGNTNPTNVLHIKTAVTNTAVATIESTATNSYPFLRLKNDAREYQLTCHGALSDSFTIYDGTAGSHRFFINSEGYVGINETNPKTGLTISKLGDYSVNDGNTYYMPVGKWSSTWNAANAILDNTDYWVGFVGGYHKTGNSVNISLAPNRGNLNAQQGMYISGEATGNSSADFTVGKIVGGSATGQGTSGNLRATKDELFRITSTGQLLLGETSAFDSNVAMQFRKDNAGSQSRFIFRNRGNNGSSRVRLIMSTLNRAANADIFSGFEQYQSGGMAIFNGQSDTSHCNISVFAGNWQPITLKNGNVSGGDAMHARAYWGTSNGIQMEVGGPQSGTHKSIRFTTSHYGGERGYIGVTLGGTSYNSSSDYRMKQDVVDLTGAIDRIKSFKPRRFKWKEDPTYTVDGFLAHEAATVVPESVNGEKDAVDSNGDPVYQVIDQSKLVPVLTAALKEAIAKIEILEAKVAALESS